MSTPETVHRTRKMHDWADTLAFHLRAYQLPQPTREFRFDPVRKWRMDLAWTEWLLFAECDGGEWSLGRHSRGLGMQRDCAKWNAAHLQGWTGYRFTGSMVQSGEAVKTLVQVFQVVAGRLAQREGP